MEVYEDSNFIINEATAVTLGNFDGIHRGHQKLIETVLDCSNKFNLKSVIFSFNPHPVAFFGKKDFKTMLSTVEKKFVAEKLGVDVLIQYPFDRKFANLQPYEFVELLKEKTNCRVLVVGENYYFGKDRIGNIDILRHIGNEMGIRVIGIPRVKVDDVRVSSTRIRGLIEKGEMETVTYLLRKPYFAIGEVVYGNQRGRLMNYPTINLEPLEKKLLPPDGVYFSTVIIDNKEYYGMSNIGVNPTFGGDVKKIETHIFDFDENVYGKTAIITFYKRVRNEVKFNNIDELKLQLNKDKAFARECINDEELLKYRLKF